MNPQKQDYNIDDVKYHLELIRSHLPKYLTPEGKENLLKDISENFPFSRDPNKVYMRLKNQKPLYQGDGIIDIPFAELETRQKKFEMKYYKAIILSNTCDMNIENIRIDKPYILFSLIIPLNEYITELNSRGIERERVITFMNNLRENKISNLFYLPELKFNGQVILEESFVRFDYCVSHSNTFILNGKYTINYSPDGDRIFSFSDYGFYLFLFKISVHFSRIREGVFRN